MRWILENVDHRSKLALEMSEGSHAFERVLGTLSKRVSQKNTFSSSTFTTLTNNASDAAENSFILTVCLRIMGNRVFHRKKKKKKKESHGILSNFD